MLENFPPLPWIILASPLVACVTIVLFALRAPKLASGMALAGILVSFVSSAALFWFHANNHFLPVDFGVTWVAVPGLSAQLGYLLDPTSLVMLLVVTGVAACVFLYSTAYMHDDPGYPRYFASLSLFAFSMLGIVLANNFLMLFVFWELVAVSSYLLIGFWFEKPSAADAGNKAFIVNRVADFGFLLGILTVWALSGAGGAERTFSFEELARRVPGLVSSGAVSHELMAVAALLVFCGVIGKSAQFPLYVWLPDAMEGPTPVSALIHAATMVAAGVFLLARTFFLIGGSEQALQVIAWTGVTTAILAGLLAVVQDDIKKILAYSTVSQLGYMVMAMGLASPTASMYHLTTHAFFKALLFLGAGAMIHALHTQNIWEMGGLLKRMPVTGWTFVIGTLALCGIAPLSGFFSKDEILTAARHHNLALYGLALGAAGLTAFYMARALWIAVLGPERIHKKHDKHGHGHGHESHAHDGPWTMTLPLVFLAFLSVTAGFFGLPAFLSHGHGHHPLDWEVAITSTIAALAGLAAGTALYRRVKGKDDPLALKLGGLHKVLVNKYYLDDLFSGLARFFRQVVAGAIFWFDTNFVIRGLVNGSAGATARLADVLRRSQTGRLRTYAMAFSFGVVVLAYFALKGGF